MSDKLGAYYVEFSATGVKAMTTSVDSILEHFKKLEASGKKMAETLTSSFRTASTAVAALAAAGLVGTVEGNRMAFAWVQLSRQISGILLPVFNTVTEVVRKATTALRAMSSAQQDSILKFGGFAAGIAMIASGVGVIPGVILTAVSSFMILKDVLEDISRVMRTLKGDMEELTKIFSFENLKSKLEYMSMISPTAKTILDGINAMEKFNPAAAEALGKKPGADVGKGNREPSLAPKGFESITSTYGRIALASMQYADPQTKATREVKDEVSKTNSKLDQLTNEVRRGSPVRGRGGAGD